MITTYHSAHQLDHHITTQSRGTPGIVRRRRKAILGLSIASALLLAGCGADESSAESLEEMGDTTLVVQSPYGPNHFMSRMWDDYADAVEEATEGKITFEISYSSSIVEVAEQEAALRDGLLDMAWSMPAYDPGELPINALFTEIAFLPEKSPQLSFLQGYGSSEFGSLAEPLQNELQNAGLVSLSALVHQYSGYPLLCAGGPVTSLEDFAGSRIRVPGAGWASEVESLGGTPVNIVQNEVYESLERGVVDCAIVAPGNSYEAGLFDVADYWVVDSETTFQGWNSTHILIAERVWEDLPLEAQQILWDEAGSTLLRSMMQYSMDSSAEELLTADEQVEILEFEDDVRQALNAHHEDTITDAEARLADLIGENTLIGDYQENQERWLELVTALGYSDDDHSTWLEWAESHRDQPVDLDPFFEAFEEEVVQPHRPE
ncbi:TRAP transporter substrate-binding protein DctP [Nesterenkonia muleiensis]|uniref:TRAP transporter substrate-binding protein DctP n=1 Tax=Nesterenkonia muleiensis TaxID=2282648 RepID=UPI000E762338|nr:TRAP transporter substrate-binding protein DctP [Nesterenkonia muleiensis]